MPFCDFLNLFVSALQFGFNIIFSVTNLPPPNFSDVFGSILGCNIV